MNHICTISIYGVTTTKEEQAAGQFKKGDNNTVFLSPQTYYLLSMTEVRLSTLIANSKLLYNYGSRLRLRGSLSSCSVTLEPTQPTACKLPQQIQSERFVYPATVLICFYVFGKLQESLKTTHFWSHEQVQKSVHHWLHSQSQKLVT